MTLKFKWLIFQFLVEYSTKLPKIQFEMGLGTRGVLIEILFLKLIDFHLVVHENFFLSICLFSVM